MYSDKKFLLIPLGTYIIWVLSTYMLEGRINLLQQQDVLGRFSYVVVSNILIGNILAIYLIKRSVQSRFCSINQLGFCSMKRTVPMVTIAIIIGLFLFMIQQPSSLNPILIMNIFAQTLPTSIAEVVVCWVLMGVSFESFLLTKKRISDIDKRRKIIYIILAALIATVFFGLYHFAHSEPFNQVKVVLFLMLPGLLTSAFYFTTRDVYSTIIFHNFLAMYGVMESVNSMELLFQPSYPIITLAIGSILVLITLDLVSLRKPKKMHSQL